MACSFYVVPVETVPGTHVSTTRLYVDRFAYSDYSNWGWTFFLIFIGIHFGSKKKQYNCYMRI